MLFTYMLIRKTISNFIRPIRNTISNFNIIALEYETPSVTLLIDPIRNTISNFIIIAHEENFIISS